MVVKHLTAESEYKALINGAKLVVVDFYADWCGPCKMVAPKVAAFSDTYPNAIFVKVNVEELESVSQEAAVRAMPTFHLYKGGVRLEEVVGANPALLEAAIKKHYA